jgi:hypothetical protein
MDEMLRLVNEDDKVQFTGDIRRVIVASILRLVAFEGETPPSHYRRIEEAATKLRGLIRDLPEYYQVKSMMDRTIAHSQRRSRAPSVRVDWARKLYAAHLAYQLLWDNATSPTLTSDGPFVQLTKALIEISTGKVQDDGTVARACSQHFKRLKQEGANPYYAENSWRRRQPAEIAAIEDANQLRSLRLREAASFPSLKVLLEEMIP